MSSKISKKIDAHIESTFQKEIIFQGIRTHNLRNIDITLPKNKVITITGVSGSGKSSLAFDTIYKEGQYRYIESLSSYLRQFFNLGERPDIDHCEWLSPSIAIEQNKKAGNSRSTVWTLTEIDDYMRLLFAKLGDSFCYSCGKEIKPKTLEQIMDEVKEKYLWKKVFLLKESWTFKTADNMKKFVKWNRNKVEKWEGFTRYLVVPENKEFSAIEYFYLEEPSVPEKFYPVAIYWIYDRVTIETSKLDRLKEDIIKILLESPKFGLYTDDSEIDEKIERFTDKMYCAECNVTYPEFTPQHFSPNRQEWACEECHGIGEVLQIDYSKVIDQNSAYNNAILPWRDSNFWQTVLQKIAEKYSIDQEKTWRNLPDWFKEVVINGDDELIRVNQWGKYTSLRYQGIENILKEQYIKWLLTVDFQAMLNMKPCPICNGAKLRRESLNVFIFSKESKYNISDLQKITITNLLDLLEIYAVENTKSDLLVNRITKPLIDRLKTIKELWLWYITLNRTINTLSGGETQRLRLAKQLGNKLTWITYVLDEPTIGLSDREIKKAIESIRKLQQMGNTVIVVEHNEDFIKTSDRVVEIWPWAGDFWWNLVFNWSYADFIKSDSLTAKYITGKEKILIDFEHQPSDEYVRIRKASKFNLKWIDVNIRLWSFTVITGASGAGKTTLMYSTLYKFLNDKEKFIQSYVRLQLLKKWMSWEEIISAPIIKKDIYEHYESLALQEFYADLSVDTILGVKNIKNTIYVDQSSIGKTPRSCPATFIGTFDKIRQIYAGTTQSKYLWFNASYFSFNSKKWACTACNGYGYKKVELQFLPDTYVPCELCKGQRYKSEILWIKRKGKTISEVLDMYVYDALELFSEIDDIREQLELLNKIGLGYIKMWQPAHTLSWWESQRLKLVKHLLKKYRGHTVYFLDEPTVWLHPQDIEKLLLVLKEFLDNGDTILMIEHDKNILQFADDIIDLDDWKLIKNKKS